MRFSAPRRLSIKIYQGGIWADGGRGIVEREAGDRRGDRIYREFTRRRGVLHQALAERTRDDGLLGRQGKEYARHRFLITRHLQEYVGLLIY